MYNCIECMRLCFEKMASGFANVISLSFENRTKANLKNCNRFFFFSFEDLYRLCLARTSTKDGLKVKKKWT